MLCYLILSLISKTYSISTLQTYSIMLCYLILRLSFYITDIQYYVYLFLRHIFYVTDIQYYVICYLDIVSTLQTYSIMLCVIKT